MTIKEFFHGADMLAGAINLGPLEQGHYIQVGLSTGFYVPELDFQQAQARADELGRVQFLGVTKDGKPLHSDTREVIHKNPESSGVIAWIVPRGRQA